MVGKMSVGMRDDRGHAEDGDQDRHHHEGVGPAKASLTIHIDASRRAKYRLHRLQACELPAEYG